MTRIAAEFAQAAGDRAAGHGDHFDRQGEGAQGVHQLALVDDADEMVGGRGDDLLPRVGTAPTLDQGVVQGHLVRPVDIGDHGVGLVEIDDLDAVPGESF